MPDADGAALQSAGEKDQHEQQAQVRVHRRAHGAIARGFPPVHDDASREPRPGPGRRDVGKPGRLQPDAPRLGAEPGRRAAQHESARAVQLRDRQPARACQQRGGARLARLGPQVRDLQRQHPLGPERRRWC
eukprot:2231979-Rhodomonas_salina.2